MYAYLELQIERIEKDDFHDKNENPESSNKCVKGENIIQFDFEKDDDFMRYYNEYKRRIMAKTQKKQPNDEQDDIDEKSNKNLKSIEENDPFKSMKFIRNPAKPSELVIYFPIEFQLIFLTYI